MGVYLKIGKTDVSRFITENKYTVATLPVYDEDSAFTNIYGEKMRTRTGSTADISAVLYDVDDETASQLAAELKKGRCNVIYSAPLETEAEFECVQLSMSLDRVYKGQKFWTSEIKLHAAFIPEDGL